MSELFRAATAVWPDIAVSEADYDAFVSERCEAGVSDDIAADLLLVCGCLAGDPAAVRAFDADYVALVPQWVARVVKDASAHDEVRQRLRERLLVARGQRPPKLADYTGKGRLKGWLRVVSVRLALDLQTAAKPYTDIDEVELPQIDDPELRYLQDRYRDDFKRAFETALEGLPERERTVLRLHLVDGLGIDAIAPIYDVHRATAARWLTSAREQLFTDTRRVLKERLGVSHSEFQSIVRLVQSQLDVSIRRLLARD